jgi:hypothetical protein
MTKLKTLKTNIVRGLFLVHPFKSSLSGAHKNSWKKIGIDSLMKNHFFSPLFVEFLKTNAEAFL